MMKIEIKHRFTGTVLYSHECKDNTVAKTLRAAIKAGAVLIGADLRYSDLRDADLRKADLRGAVIDGVAVPSTEEAAPLLKKVAKAALSAPNALVMVRWHTCDTSHCIAGWAIALSGEKGLELEAKYGSANAGMLLLGVEAATHFYDDNESARTWLQSVLEGGK